MKPTDSVGLYQKLLTVTYEATVEDWHIIANYFEVTGEKRLAQTIREGIARNRGKWAYIRNDPEWPLALRFKQGSVHKLARLYEAMNEANME